MKTKVYAHFDLTCNFTIVPSHIVTDKARVELRASVISESSYDKEIEIKLYLDEFDNEKFISGTGKFTLESGKQRLYADFISTKGLRGDHKLMAAFYADGMPIAAEYISIRIVPSETKALPFVQVMWIEPGSYNNGLGNKKADENDAREYIRLLSFIGVHSVVIAHTEGIAFGSGAYYPSGLPEFEGIARPIDFDYVNTVLDEAEKLDMNVFVGLGRHYDTLQLRNGLGDKTRIEMQLDYGKRLSSELWSLYGKYNSFYGWYIAYGTDDITCSNEYYNHMADILHSYCPDKPVMIALSGMPVVSPDIINGCRYEIVAYQDAVGSGNIPMQNTFNQENRIRMLHEIYMKYQGAHAGTDVHIWSNLEMWKMDGPAYKDAYASDWSQIARQLEIERNYVSCVCGYAVPSCIQNPNGAFCFKGYKYQKSFDLYNDYKAYYEKACVHY